MPFYSMNAKFTHTEEEMRLVISSQRHLRHCFDTKNWVDEWGAVINVNNHQRMQRTTWYGFMGVGYDKSEKRFLRIEDIIKSEKYKSQFLALYNPLKVVRHLVYDHGLTCPLCKSIYDKDTYDRYRDSNSYKYENSLHYARMSFLLCKLFDPVPDDLIESATFDLFYGHPPACDKCLKDFIFHALSKRHLKPFFKENRNQIVPSDSDLEMIADEFAAFNLAELASKVRMRRSKARGKLNNRPRAKE